MRAPRPLVCILALAAAAPLTGCGEKAEEATPAAGGDEREVVVELEKVGRFTEPIHLAQPPGRDSAVYVVERAGTVRALTGGEVAPEPFLDISRNVLTEGEGGLFSIAFSPAYRRDGLLYVAYASRDQALVVDELEADPAQGEVDARSRREVLSIAHPNLIHWGGLLAFGPDGDLYLGTGDGGPAYPIPDTAQDPRSPLGKLLRIDPRSGRTEVVALGLRNPWRYSFDSRTGDLWIGDVGDFTQEEIDFLPAERVGERTDFGWPAREGTAPTKSDARAPGSERPLFTYERTGRDDDPLCAITGGLVVRDRRLAPLAGRYLYADFCAGEIMSLARRGGGMPEVRDTGLRLSRLVSFAEGASGAVYVLSLEGPVHRLVAG